MFTQSDIKEHMRVIADDGVVIGLVDQLEGGTQTVKLERDVDEHVHHWIPLAWVKKVDARGVHINANAATACTRWQSSPPQLAVGTHN